MGLIFDKIDAEVAAREGLIAAAGVGRLHLLPMRDRSLIEKRTRNIRAIRNDAAAKLGVLPGFEVVKFGQTFRVDFHKPNKTGWGFIGPRGVHQIYASATNLSTGKVHIWNGARKERLQCPNMPTGIRTANVIGTDAQGDPVYNYDLSRRRAQSVVQALIDLGVPADLLVSRGYGPSRPIGDNRTSEGRALNRRVDFRTIVAD